MSIENSIVYNPDKWREKQKTPAELAREWLEYARDKLEKDRVLTPPMCETAQILGRKCRPDE